MWACNRGDASSCAQDASIHLCLSLPEERGGLQQHGADLNHRTVPLPLPGEFALHPLCWSTLPGRASLSQLCLRWKLFKMELCPAPSSPLADAGGMLAAHSAPSPAACPAGTQCTPGTPKVREGSGKSRGRGLIFNLLVMVPQAPCRTAETGRAGPGWPEGSAPPVPAVRALPEVLSSVVLQVVYDEGPLYIFSPTEELRKRWIHQLKSGECRALQLPQLCQGLTGSWLPIPCVSKSELLLPGAGGHCRSLQLPQLLALSQTCSKVAQAGSEIVEGKRK